jgi:hypothetical protein
MHNCIRENASLYPLNLPSIAVPDLRGSDTITYLRCAEEEERRIPSGGRQHHTGHVHQGFIKSREYANKSSTKRLMVKLTQTK